MKNRNRIIAILMALIIALLGLSGCDSSTSGSGDVGGSSATITVTEDGSYDSKEEVCQYLITFGHLPDNYITKSQARKLGWQGGSLEAYAEGKCIGGDRFGNREGALPKGEEYTECDIDTLGEDSRGAKRIVFSSDGDIYYTGDHYNTFQQLAEGWEEI